MESRRLTAGSSSSAIPARASNGAAASQIRPFDSAIVSMHKPRAAARQGRSPGDPPDARTELRELLFDALVAAVDVVDPIDGGVTVRHQPGEHQTRRGPQIVAMTGAAVSRSTPRVTAVLPVSWMSAPMRWSSWTCMNRFSNTVSEIVAAPSATTLSAVNWACMSVGNAG